MEKKLNVGPIEGDELGEAEGDTVGCADGTNVGSSEVGAGVGFTVGAHVSILQNVS